MFVIEDELNHFEEKCMKNNRIQNLLSKNSDPDPVQLFRIRIRTWQKVLDLAGSGFSIKKVKKHRMGADFEFPEIKV